jgi:hypothetical protein
MPTKARSTIVRFTVLVASLSLGACAGDSTAPTARTASADASVSSFVPSAATRSLVGVSDGTYEFQIDPTRDQGILLGANYLSLPANSICDISQSSYGAGHWDEPCSPERLRVKITAVVKNAHSSHPSIDFYPAMRFNPRANVSLYMYIPAAERTTKSTFVIGYCNDANDCVDESLTDPSLVTQTDRTNSVVFRRIKHFSGYIVWGLVNDVSSLLF